MNNSKILFVGIDGQSSDNLPDLEHIDCANVKKEIDNMQAMLMVARISSARLAAVQAWMDKANAKLDACNAPVVQPQDETIKHFFSKDTLNKNLKPVVIILTTVAALLIIRKL